MLHLGRSGSNDQVGQNVTLSTVGALQEPLPEPTPQEGQGIRSPWHGLCFPQFMTHATNGTLIDMRDSIEGRRPSDPNDLTENAQGVQNTLAEGGGVVDRHVSMSDESARSEPQSTVERPQNKVLGWLEDISHKWGAAHLKTLVQKRGRLSQSMSFVPDSMHRVANQTRLVLEMIDDFRDGTYREVSWRSVALLTGGILYSVSPADVVPDAFPFVGQFDDLVVIAIVTRLVHGDLRKYCQFKGYEEAEYFRK